MKEQFDPVSTGELKEREERFSRLTPEEKQKEINTAHEEADLLHGKNFNERAVEEKDPEMQKELRLAFSIAESVKVEGGMALVVGGFARDEALNRFGYNLTSKDIDIEVYGVQFERLQEILKEFGETDVVGVSFGVIKLGGLDISIPRRDSKTGTGHKGFTVEGDPTMTIEEAARRRDFTINALALDPLTGEMVDKFGGLDDIKNGLLRVTDPETFIEDPLRVLRGMQFAGRFNFDIDPETVELCRSMDLTELPAERLKEEWIKLLTKSPKPSVGLEAGRELGVIEKLHPELQALIGVPQDKVWHPEGDVWIHTGMVLDCAAEICRRENLSGEEQLVIMFGALAHDLGKPATTTLRESDGKIIAHSHSKAGMEPARKFLESLKMPHDIIKKILPIIQEHLWPAEKQNRNPTQAAVRHLANRLYPATIEELVWISEADQHGRTLPWNGFPAGQELIQKARELKVSQEKPKKLVQGRDLIAIGLKPGVHFTKIINTLYEAQLDGEFSTIEEGIEFYNSNPSLFQK